MAGGSGLSLIPGMVVKFTSGTVLHVDGTLNILGVEGNPVTLTSFADDTIGGDSNNDGGLDVPGPGDWAGIANLGHMSLLNHMNVRYAGTALETVEGSATIRYSTITGSVRGIHVVGPDWAPFLECNNLYGNVETALANSSSLTVSAEDHWWGDAAGPAAGAISGDVDFDPWATSPCIEPPPDLAATLVDSPDPVERGQLLTYAVTVANLGGGDAINAVMTLALSNWLEEIALTDSSLPCEVFLSPAAVSCVFERLPAGYAAVVFVTATVSADAPGGYLHAGAGVSNERPETGMANNTTATTTTVMSEFFLPQLVR